MNKTKVRLRPTINPTRDTTEPGLVGAPEDAWNIIKAQKKLNAKGLEGILDNLAEECLELLQSEGLYVQPPNSEHDVPIISQNDLIRMAQTDPYLNEIAGILMGVFYLRRDLRDNDMQEIESYVMQALLLGASAKSAELSTIRKYADTGMKVLSGLEDANRAKSDDARHSKEVVQKRMRKLLDNGVKKHNLVSMYRKIFGNKYGERQLRRFKKDL